MPLMIALSQYSERASNFMRDDISVDLLFQEATYIADTLVNCFSVISMELIKACTKTAMNEIYFQIFIVCALLGITLLSIIILFGLIFFIILKVISQNRLLLSLFGFITPEEIDDIISISQKVLINNKERVKLSNGPGYEENSLNYEDTNKKFNVNMKNSNISNNENEPADYELTKLISTKSNYIKQYPYYLC